VCIMKQITNSYLLTGELKWCWNEVNMKVAYTSTTLNKTEEYRLINITYLSELLPEYM